MLKDELISEIVELMKIGDRDIPIYPPWIQFRLNNWDTALSKLYEKYKERLINLFGFDYILSRIKGSSSTYNLIQEKLHPSSLNEHENIVDKKTLWNSNIKLGEVYDWIKHYGMNNLKYKTWLSKDITNDLWRSLKLDLQFHYEDWWAYMFSIFDRFKSFTTEHLQIIYFYLDNIQKRHDFLKSL